MLQALAAEVTDKTVITTPEPSRASKPGFDVESYSKDYGIKIKGVRSHGTSTLNLPEECVFDPSHSGSEAAIGQTEEGKLFYQCFHDSCKGRTWAEARKIISGEDKLAKYSSLPATEKRKDEPKAGDGLYFPRGFTATELISMEFPEKQWLIPGVLPKGLTVLGGKPRTGKSWLALNYALAIAAGGTALGEIATTKQQVAYLVLEDNSRRLKRRLSSCCSGGCSSSWDHLFH
jgi:hypothetical protein